MRTIKFRAQDIASNKWLYGDIRHRKNCVCIFEQGGNIGEQVKPETIGQFTGCHDKHGNPIYEGDIIKMLNCDFQGVVQWHKDGYFFIDEFFPKKVESDYAPLGRMLRYCMAVIGNIHDNPELLKGGEQ